MSLEKGCRNAVEICMGISSEDKVMIVCDDNTLSIGKTLDNYASKKTQDVHLFNLDSYGNRPLPSLPNFMRDIAMASTATFWTASSPKGELESVRMPFIKAAITNGRHAHMVSITDEIVEKTLGGDYRKVEKFTNKIYSLAKVAKEVRITTEKGTDLRCGVGKYRWVSSTGVIRGTGDWHNLPDGEVFTAPYSMEGIAVIDGTIGDYFDEKFSLADIQETPIELRIEGKDPSQLVDISCDNKELKEEIESYVDQNPCSRSVGELGIGTNIQIDKLCGVMLVDEKYPATHIAFGDPLGSMTKAKWSCPEHIDMLILDCNIWFDDTLVMEKGKYLIDEL